MNVVSLSSERLEALMFDSGREGPAATPASLPATQLAFDRLLTEVLAQANRFVPSHAGSILLAERTLWKPAGLDRLVFVACFGPRSEELVGMALDPSEGVAGRVARSGEPYLCRRAGQDVCFSPCVDHKLGLETSSIVAAPLRIDGDVCGVIELLYRGDGEYGDRDLALLELFADYTALLVRTSWAGHAARTLANRDHLTGLYNDRYLHQAVSEAVEAALAAEQDVSLLFLDLDNFKQFVDANGHLAGSHVIASMGPVLTSAVSWPGARVFRYGGDEFVLLLPDADEATAVALGEQLRIALSQHGFTVPPGLGHAVPDHPAYFTLSVGAASLGRRRREDYGLVQLKNGLIHAADTAMYQAKHDGKNRVQAAGQWVLEGAL